MKLNPLLKMKSIRDCENLELIRSPFNEHKFGIVTSNINSEEKISVELSYNDTSIIEYDFDDPILSHGNDYEIIIDFETSFFGGHKNHDTNGVIIIAEDCRLLKVKGHIGSTTKFLNLDTGFIVSAPQLNTHATFPNWSVHMKLHERDERKLIYRHSEKK